MSPPPPLSDSSRPLLARVRHELRTPVNHIIGYSEILLEDAEGVAPPSFLEDLERIRNGGRQLLALINEHLGDGAAAPVARDWQRIHHELRTPVHQIVGYSELLAERCDELGLADFKPDLERIRAAATTWLRLMERHLADAAEGRLEIAPARHRKDTEFADTPRVAPEEDSAPARGLGRVLVTDDDPINRDLLCRRLQRLGYLPVPCQDGRRLIETLRAEPADLVLLDLLMPGLDGATVLARMKQDTALRHIPVVVVSALDATEGIARCIALGAEDYLTKPVEPALLRARLSAALEKKRLRDAEQLHLRQLEAERARSEQLLLNVLPRPTAERLKQGETTIVDQFAEVTVLFGDLVGFTAFAARRPPEQVVAFLNEIFSAFDELAVTHGLEKIKTIGDAYMAVAGLPEPRPDHAPAAVRMAREMLAVLRDLDARQHLGLQMRIGLNTGPVTAGIIGRHKFSYDLWGDTVNLASRMESLGLPGAIQMGEATARRLGDQFPLTPRGPLDIKGKGRITAWLLAPPHA